MTIDSGISRLARTSASRVNGSVMLPLWCASMSTMAEETNSTVLKPELKLRAAFSLSSRAGGIGAPVS